MKLHILLMSALVLALFVGASFGSASAAPAEPDPNGRAWGSLIEGEPGVWRAHFALLGIEDGNGRLFGNVVSGLAQSGEMGNHASGK
jgi:hypothetical protein